MISTIDRDGGRKPWTLRVRFWSSASQRVGVFRRLRTRNEWKPRPTDQKRKSWTSEAHHTGPGASPLSTNRGRHVPSSLWWAAPSCLPDVSSSTAGGAKLYLSPCRLTRREEQGGRAGDRVVAESSNADPLQIPRLLFFAGPKRGTLLPRGGAVL